MAKRSSQGIRNLQSAGRTAAKFTGRTTEKAAVCLARWATTDHLGTGRALENMPSMGFVATLKIILMRFLFAVEYSCYFKEVQLPSLDSFQVGKTSVLLLRLLRFSRRWGIRIVPLRVKHPSRQSANGFRRRLPSLQSHAGF
jgi:hypothetical protein